MSFWEIAGFAAGAVSVWLYVRQNVWAWPVGIANSLCWFVLFSSARLYLDAGLQLVYVVLGLIGWIAWLRGDRQGGQLAVRRATGREIAVLSGIGLVATAVLWRAMVVAGDAAPLADAATAVVSLTAQYMLTRKLLGNWWCWIAVDLAYVVLYTSQGLYLTAALQPLFIVMCVIGLRQWRASMAAADPGRSATVAAR
jgi:nicotinamide mononucleotide transporter